MPTAAMAISSIQRDRSPSTSATMSGITPKEFKAANTRKPTTNPGISGGRYVQYAQDTPLANLWVTVLSKLGLPIETFGDSTGPLAALDS